MRSYWTSCAGLMAGHDRFIVVVLFLIFFPIKVSAGVFLTEFYYLKSNCPTGSFDGFSRAAELDHAVFYEYDVLGGYEGADDYRFFLKYGWTGYVLEGPIGKPVVVIQSADIYLTGKVVLFKNSHFRKIFFNQYDRIYYEALWHGKVYLIPENYLDRVQCWSLERSDRNRH